MSILKGSSTVSCLGVAGERGQDTGREVAAVTGLGWVHLCRSSGSGGWPRLRMLDTSLHTAKSSQRTFTKFHITQRRTLLGPTIALSEESMLNGGANTVSWHDIGTIVHKDHN